MEDNFIRDMIITIAAIFALVLPFYHFGRALIIEDVVKNPAIVLEANKIVKEHNISPSKAYIVAKNKILFATDVKQNKNFDVKQKNN